MNLSEEVLRRELEEALFDAAPQIREAYKTVERENRGKPEWLVPGYFDRLLSTRYAGLIAPRLAARLGIPKEAE